MQRCDVGLIGWGTVGSGVIDLVTSHGNLFRERCGLDIGIKAIVTKSPDRRRAQSAGRATVGSDIRAFLNDPNIPVVMHLVGGTPDATELFSACIKAKKHVITAN